MAKSFQPSGPLTFLWPRTIGWRTAALIAAGAGGVFLIGLLLRTDDTEDSNSDSRSFPAKPSTVIRKNPAIASDKPQQQRRNALSAEEKRIAELENYCARGRDILAQFPPDNSPWPTQAALVDLSRAGMHWAAGSGDAAEGKRALQSWVQEDPESRNRLLGGIEAALWKVEIAEFINNPATRNVMRKNLEQVFASTEPHLQKIQGWDGDAESFKSEFFGQKPMIPPPLSTLVSTLEGIQSGQITQDTSLENLGIPTADLSPVMLEYIRNEVRSRISASFVTLKP